MEIYIIISIVLAFFSFAQNARNKLFFLLIALVGLFIITGWRSISVGTDTIHYYVEFGRISNQINFLSIRSKEFFYPYLMFFVNKIGGDFRVFLVILTLLFSICVYFICRSSKKPVFTLFIFWLLGYYFLFFNISRQILSSVIAVCAFFLFEQKRYKWWIILTVFAILIHTSAIMAFLLWPISKITIKSDKRWIVAMFLIVTFLIPFVFDTRNLAIWLNGLGVFGDIYQLYIPNVNEGRELFSIGRISINIFYVAMLFWERNNENHRYLIFIIFYIAVLNLFPFSSVVGRIAILFGIFQVLYLTYIASLSKLNTIVVLVYPISVFIMFLAANNGGMIPYVFGSDGLF